MIVIAGHETFLANEVAKNDPRHEAHARDAEACMRTPSSFIRTVTVGSGIRPDLLTLRITEALAGLHFRAYRRWGIAPRPEDVMEAGEPAREVYHPAFGHPADAALRARSGRLAAQVQEQRPGDASHRCRVAPCIAQYVAMTRDGIATRTFAMTRHG